jgi:hypothetical protein
MKQQIDYKQYLASREWRVKRKEVIELNDNICQRCASRPIENIHHLSYENIGDEDPSSELMGVCRPCHEYLAAERDDDPALQVIQEIIYQHGLFPLEEWPSQKPNPSPYFISGTSKTGLILFVTLIRENGDDDAAGEPKCVLSPGVIAVFGWMGDRPCQEK